MRGEPEHFDVIIVGAGITGIGAACLLQKHCPGKTFCLLEARDAIGGTWDLFRFPGIRSDSDMFTLGYSFRPWDKDEIIADGASIRAYIEDTAREHGIVSRIRFSHKVREAAWSGNQSRWSVEAEHTETGETVRLTCGFLHSCAGYYRYDQGYLPDFAGSDRFAGQIIHPQHWPEDLDYRGMQVVVIGSGATAATIVPAMSKDAAHVTMLQRSPSYFVSLPSKDPLAPVLGRILPSHLRFRLMRGLSARLADFAFRLSRRRPALVKALVRRGLKRGLPAGYPLDPHFRPRYDPWHQRPCFVPDGNLFEAIAQGAVSMVTDEIDTFTEKGVRLASGSDLDADLIVTATGLNLCLVGGLNLTVDGKQVEYGKTVVYKRVMLSGVPNFAWAFGYTHNAWTLGCELASEYVCRLLNHMDAKGYTTATARAPGPEVDLDPLIDLSAGYVLRGIENMPRQGSRTPWRLHQTSHPRNMRMLRRGPIEDEGIEFSGPADRPIPSAFGDKLTTAP